MMQYFGKGVRWNKPPRNEGRGLQPVQRTEDTLPLRHYCSENVVPFTMGRWCVWICQTARSGT